MAAAAVAATSCNDEVFVKPSEAVDPDPGGDPSNPNPPAATDSLVLLSIEYDDATISLTNVQSMRKDIINFEFHTATGGDAVVFYDNHNSSIVYFKSNTYFVTPWAQLQPSVSIPTLDDDMTPGLWGVEMPFKIGLSLVPLQYMAGHEERLYVPGGSKVTATVHVLQRLVTAQAEIKYYVTDAPGHTPVDAKVNVEVWQPVEITVEWSDITPI